MVPSHIEKLVQNLRMTRRGATAPRTGESRVAKSSQKGWGGSGNWVTSTRRKYPPFVANCMALRFPTQELSVMGVVPLLKLPGEGVEMKTLFQVSADHVHPDYRLDNAIVTVEQHSDDTYSAWLPKFGYVCNFPTPEAAIRDLLLANGCRNIRIDNGR